MRIALGLAAAACLWAAPAAATDWYMVAVSDGKTTASFVDRDSIADMGANMRRAKTYQVFSVDKTDGTAAFQPFLEFDCSGARYRFISIKSINASGTVTRDDVGSGKWRTIDAGSMDEAQQQFVCSGGAKPASAVGYGSGPLIARGRARLRDGTRPNTYGGH
jgi:hypothetical protein